MAIFENVVIHTKPYVIPQSEGMAVRAMVYAGNGIVLLGDDAYHVWRSGCAYKTDEATSESAISQATPASAGAAGHKGEVRWDDGFIYVCVADDTWERVAIDTWV